ncbi:MAG: aminopeptidase P N-terminal domain-containing protein [Nitrospinae bacterium]|nr:aminopeptidase P N-terminal domain-containing protein [Nitrospinota bacterium]
MPGIKKNKYSGIFRDGGAGRMALRRFRERREKLMERENALMVITGVPYGPGQETTWSYAYCPTYQEPAIMYLTGVNQPGVVLLLDPHSKKSDEILFVNKKDPVKEFWDGVHLGVGSPRSAAEARRVTGIKEVRDIKEFEKVLKERFDEQPEKKLGTLWIEGARDGKKALIKTDHNWNFRNKVARLVGKWKAPSKTLFNVMKSHFDLRLPLDAYDAANTLKAQRITGEAFKRTLRSFRDFNNECQVQGFIDGQMLMRSSFGLSFPTIVASGANATTLHYVKNDDDFGKAELVLIDFGVRWMTMHADISRTVPASGRFDPLQKALYEIVLRAQARVEKKARMGVTIKELNDLCWSSVNHELENGFKSMGGKWKLKYKQRPHGVSHLIGEQEHDGDPFRNYADEPMKAGWLISNEPGLYGYFRLRHKGKLYDEEIGIRIEDNLLITESGCRNLSRCIPKSVDEIEGLMWSGKSAR